MQQRGFTLVELIITLIIIGVLAVTAIPRFFGSQSEDAFALRDRTLALVRTVQLQAMHDIASTNCVKITANLIAPPQDSDCAKAISTDFEDQLVVDSSGTGITFFTTNNQGSSFNSLRFNHLGEPILVDCSNTCEIQMNNQKVCISAAGAVYGC